MNKKLNTISELKAQDAFHDIASLANFSKLVGFYKRNTPETKCIKTIYHKELEGATFGGFTTSDMQNLFLGFLWY